MSSNNEVFCIRDESEAKLLAAVLTVPIAIELHEGLPTVVTLRLYVVV